MRKYIVALTVLLSVSVNAGDIPFTGNWGSACEQRAGDVLIGAFDQDTPKHRCIVGETPRSLGDGFYKVSVFCPGQNENYLVQFEISPCAGRFKFSRDD